MTANAYDPSTEEAVAEGSLVPGQPGLNVVAGPCLKTTANQA